MEDFPIFQAEKHGDFTDKNHGIIGAKVQKTESNTESYGEMMEYSGMKKKWTNSMWLCPKLGDTLCDHHAKW